MSRLLAFSLCAAVAALFAPAARAADEPKDILAKAIKAHGGETALTKHKAGESKAKGKIDIPGVGEAEFTQETMFMLPDKFRDTMELKIAGQTVSIFTLINGDKITIEANGQAVDIGDKAKDAMKDVGHIIEIGQLVPLKDKKYELSLIGDDKVEGKKVVGIRVSAKGKKDASVYFDKETGLIAKIEYRTVDPTSGNEIAEERIITEYTMKKDTPPTPKTILLKRDGKKFLEAEILEMKMHEKLDDGLFKK